MFDLDFLHKPQVEGNNENISRKEIKSLRDDLGLYDVQHNAAGQTMLRMEIAMIQQIADPGEKIEEAKKFKAKIDSFLTVEKIFEKHSVTLQELGLEIESPNKKGNIDYNEILAEGRIKVHLANGELFCNFLKTLNRSDIEEGQTEKQNGYLEFFLQSVLGKFGSQIEEEYSLDPIDDRLLDLFLVLPEIISECERLGLDRIISRLRTYKEHMDAGDLKDYINRPEVEEEEDDDE